MRLGFTVSLHFALFALIAKPPSTGTSGLTTACGAISAVVFGATLLRYSEVVENAFPALVPDDS